MSFQKMGKNAIKDLVFFIEKGEILDGYMHPNQAYFGQRIMVRPTPRFTESVCTNTSP
jgi:hypothetical protein